jgi:GT2 family glycosyltransferase
MTQPLVSIITVNYNGVSYTADMLYSIQQISYPEVEIIVVDNNSEEDPSPLLSSFPYIKLIRSKKNLGFAGGNNLGIAQALGKYVLFLNNDTEVHPYALEPLVETLESNSRIGVVSPKILFFGSRDKKTLQYAGSNGINPYTIRGEKIGSFEMDYGQYDDIRETALGHGAAMMVPMEVIREVGLIPDIYFLYYEEHDWFEKIKRAGYKVFYVGSSTVYHKESMTVGQNSVLRTYYLTRGRLLFTRRNTAGLQWLSSLLFFLLLAFPKNIIKHLAKGEYALLKAFIHGTVWHLHHTDVYRNPFLQLSEGQKYIVANSSPHILKTFN